MPVDNLVCAGNNEVWSARCQGGRAVHPEVALSAHLQGLPCLFVKSALLHREVRLALPQDLPCSTLRSAPLRCKVKPAIIRGPLGFLCCTPRSALLYLELHHALIFVAAL